MGDSTLTSKSTGLLAAGDLPRLAAEFLGTFVLVLLGCGSAVLAAGGDNPAVGNNIVSIGLTFGLAIVIMAYTVGRISGGHFNPAVSLGAALAGRASWRDAGLYAATQVVGATVAALVLLVLALGLGDFSAGDSLGANGFGDRSPSGEYAWWAAFLLEAVLTFVFLMVILGVTDSRSEHPELAGLVIGLALAAIHFVSIPATGTSVNPARSIGPALFSGGDAILDLWLFILAPLAGAALAGLVYPRLFGGRAETTDAVGGGAASAPSAEDAVATQRVAVRPRADEPEPAAEDPTRTSPPAGATRAGVTPGAQGGTGAGDRTGTQAAAASDEPIIENGWRWDPVAWKWRPLEEWPAEDDDTTDR